jgi:hypothetical protein
MLVAFVWIYFFSFSGHAKQQNTMPNQHFQLDNELVSVPSDRYAELEALEKSVPEKIQEAIALYKKESLRKLHERDKSDPESVKLRMQRYIAKNRDKINERRREKRRKEQLEAGTMVATANNTITDMFASLTTESKAVLNGTLNPNASNFDMTVRFDD